MDVEKKLKAFFSRVERVNKRIAEDAEDYILPDNPAAILANLEGSANALGDDNPQKSNLQVFIRMAKCQFDEGAEDALKISLLKIERCYEDIRYNNMVEKLQKPIRYGAIGGKKHHAEDRADFKQTYRLERAANPTQSRASIIDRLAKRETAKRSTLEKWAKSADDEDGFIRKGGRPKRV